MMNRMPLLSSILFYLIHCLSGLTLTYYPVVIQSTNSSNVSSFELCLCKCLSSSNCGSFGYLSSLSSPTCQIYSSFENKPNIVSFILPSNDNQTGLYSIVSLNTGCNLSIPNTTYNHSTTTTTNTSFYFPLSGSRIISVLIMSINNYSRLLAIDSGNYSYYLFNMNPLQIVDNDSFSPGGCVPLCARQFSNLLYIGCTNNIIEVRQFGSIGNSSQEKPILLKSYSTATGGPPQCLAVLNENILYYVIGSDLVYVFLTQTNTSKLIYSFSGVTFASPSVVIALDSINMGLFLASNNGIVFRLQLSLINIDNGTSNVSSGSIDQYQTPTHTFTSLLIDKCNQLWVLSSLGSSAPELLLFTQQDNSNNLFSTMSIVNYTNVLPIFTYSPYNFEFSDNYSLFTANANQGLYAFIRP